MGRPPLTRDEAEGTVLLMLAVAQVLVVACAVACVFTRNRPSIVATGVVEIALACYIFRFLLALKRRGSP